jgi:hypothetical protein
MASLPYMLGRKKYSRPQAMLWSNNSGTLVSAPTDENPNHKVYVPNGLEIGGAQGTEPDNSLNQFIILSDDNRDPIEFIVERLERRERMINGRMRSYHIADKLSISTSWSMLPSRSHINIPGFSPTTGKSDYSGNNSLEYTTDGGAGGVDILNWYEEHKGSFWVYLSYDKHSNFGSDNNAYAHIQEYSQVVEMFISGFSYSVEKRGNSNFDFWNISVSLEEV